MKQLEVTALKEDKTPVTCYVNCPETIEEAIQMFGGESVLSNAIANWKITIRAAIKRPADKGVSQAEIQANVKDAKMGTVITGGKIDPIQASLAKFKTMTVEEQAAFLEQLKAAAAGASPQVAQGAQEQTARQARQAAAGTK
jgi:hypothetical protein